jgi:intein-encoded DNA endonuclease-like protein
MKKILDEKEIIRLYLDNYSANQIAKKIGVDPCTIVKRLRDNGIEVRKSHNKYKVNENYFDIIDNENKAYWLGFLMADGYNSGKFIRVDIQDEGHLDKLRDEIYPNKDMPVRKKLSHTNKNVFYLTIQNSKFVSDCERHGIVRTKSHITKYPNIEKDFDRHFIRGLFDGDGSLSYLYQTKNYRKYNFSIVGSNQLMKEVREKILSIGVNVGFGTCKSIYRIYITGNRQISRLLDWLYNDSIVYMDRKFEKYDDMINWDGTKRDKKLNKLLNN